MSLSDTAIRKLKPGEKSFKVSDERGLYLQVNPSGSKLWRMDYQFQKKRKTLAIGAYPALSLAEARQRRDDAKMQLQRGEDPSVAKKLTRLRDAVNAGNTFGVIAAEYIEKLKKDGRSASTITKHEWLLHDRAKELVKRPIEEIQPIEILSLLQTIERRGQRETATRLRSTIGKVFRFAASTMRASSDPTSLLKDAISAPVVTSHAAITNETQFGALMQSIDEHDGWITVRYALEFIALTACRPGEVRLAEWPEFDLVKRTWTVPAERMKMRIEHVVPLCRRAVEIIKTLRGITGKERYVFCALRTGSKPLSENAMNSALKRMGYRTEDHVSHGFRSSFSTIMNERGHDPEIIEHALAHKDSSVRGIYNRSKYWGDRVTLMQAWADLIDDLKGGKTDVSAFEDLLGIENPDH